MAWRPPTLRDRSPAHTGNEPTICACGRTTQADMLVAMPPALVARGYAPYLCDACRATLHRRGEVTAAELARLGGAPAEVVAKLRRGAS